MSEMKELIKFQAKMYLLSYKYAMPFIVLLMYLGFSYSIAPLGVVDSFALSSVIIFAIMAWTGITYSNIIPDTMEEILILKTGNAKKYYWSRVIFLVLVGMTFSLIAMLYPIIQNIGNDLFLRKLTMADVLISYIIQVAAGFCGSTVGSFLHHRILKDRALAIGITVVVVLGGLVKEGIITEIPFLKWFCYLLPPAADVLKVFSGLKYYTAASVGISILRFVLYGLILTTMQIDLLKKKKF